jgi:integrase
MEKNGSLTEIKTASSHRKIALMQPCIAAIEEQQLGIGNKSNIRQISNSGDYICTDEWNNKILPENLTINFRRIVLRNNKKFEQADRKEGLMYLPLIRLHDLRHGFATIALSSGENVKVVSEILGHAKTSTTQNIYSHATETMQRASISRMENLFFKLVKLEENSSRKIVSVEIPVENQFLHKKIAAFSKV